MTTRAKAVSQKQGAEIARAVASENIAITPAMTKNGTDNNKKKPENSSCTKEEGKIPNRNT